MRVIYIVLACFCLGLIFLGVKWLIRKKTIISFLISDLPIQISLKKRGRYAICVKGDYFKPSINCNFSVSNISDDIDIDIIENLLKYRFIKKGTSYLEKYSFNIKEAGNYSLSISSSKSDNNQTVIVKETVSVLKKLGGILFLVFGVNGLFWSIILAINPNTFLE